MLPNKNDLAVYVHIPFCVSKCKYCDFVSAPGTEDEMDRYVEALCKEIRSCGKDFSSYHTISVFFGGGTPSVLSIENFTKIVNALEETFRLKRLYRDKGPFSLKGETKGKLGFYFSGPGDLKNQVEFTVECNSDTVDAEKFKAYKKLGVNRISFGLQSNSNRDLKLLGRTYTTEDFSNAYFAARDAGFENINIDLIHSIPGQNVLEFMKNLYSIMLLGPEHLSIYSLILEDGTPFKTNTLEVGEDKKVYKAEDGTEIPFPTEEEDREIYHTASGFLRKAGLERYEISNFAKEERECKHNKMYWQRGNYIGFGVSAASMVDNVRWKNVSDRDEYIKRIMSDDDIDKVKEDVEKLTAEDQMAEFVFLGLRMGQGIAKEEFIDEFGVSFDHKYGEITQRFIDEGLMEVKEFEFYDPVKKCDYVKTRVFLTDRGVDVSNRIMSEYLPL